MFLSVFVWSMLVNLLCGLHIDAPRKVQPVARAVHNVFKRATSSAFNATQADEIVAQHNLLRAKEPSTDMLNMTWSAEIAQNAQTHAERCNFTHSPGAERQNLANFSNIGENLWASTAATVNVQDFMNSWYSEKSDYNIDSNSCSKTCGHYTQVVWANSTSVGCGVKQCSTLASTAWTNAILVVCQYGPGGNINGQRPYTKSSSSAVFPPQYILIYVITSMLYCFVIKLKH